MASSEIPESLQSSLPQGFCSCKDCNRKGSFRFSIHHVFDLGHVLPLLQNVIEVYKVLVVQQKPHLWMP